jgi:hypothetical protein
VNPFNPASSIQSELLSDISDIENISYEDRLLAPDHRRIDRVFKGTNTSTSDTSSFKIGTNIMRFEAGSAYAQNKVVYSDRNNVTNNYILDTFTTTKSLKLIFNLFGDETTLGINMLFQSDDKWLPKNFVALTTNREVKMKTLTHHDFVKVQEHVRSILPADAYAKIDWKNWDFSHGALVNGYFKNEVFFHPEALASAPLSISSTTFYYGFWNYLLRTGDPGVAVMNQRTAGDPRNSGVWVGRYQNDVQKISELLSIAFDPGMGLQGRYQAFKELKDIPLWLDRGAGFMLSMLPADKLQTLISYEMTFSAHGVDTVSFKYGTFDQEELYRSLIYIQNVITNQSFDLRLYTDEKGEYRLQ